MNSGEIVATGTNDVPRFGGGLYWPGTTDQRDYKLGYDSNAKHREKIVEEILTAAEEISKDLNREELRKKLAGTSLWSITEYGRAVHAEMEALLSCARTGASTRGASLFSTTFPCHNCAKHIVAAGIERVVYVEPYPKSLALSLHADAIEFAGDQHRRSDRTKKKVRFEPFVGVGPRRFIDLFSMKLGSSYQLIRKDGINTISWDKAKAILRLPLPPTSYLEREKLAIADAEQVLGGEHEPPARNT